MHTTLRFCISTVDLPPRQMVRSYLEALTLQESEILQLLSFFNSLEVIWLVDVTVDMELAQ